MIVLPLLLLASDIIAKAGASSGQSLGVPSVGTVNTIDGSSIENDSTGRTNIQLKDAERLPAADFPVTDASSALAAKYASANIITGNIIDNEKAKSTASDTSGGGGGWFGKILGKGSSSDAEKNVASTGEIRHEIPPPPPPPPLQRQQVNNPQQQNVGSTKQTPPHQKQQLPQNYNSYNSNYPPYNPPSSYIDPAAYQNLLYELDESTLREMTLTHQLHNVSAYVDTLTSESENLIMRIDVLTERLADTNANFNFVHNRNLELEKNCTQLTATVESLSEEIIGYKSKIAGMDQDMVESEKILGELRSELRKVTDELEKLACLVETERFEIEKSDFLTNFKKKQEDKADDSSEGEERLRAAQELARSTLLHALQTERASVEELEASLITLQRNNSAIMDVVQSRNSLINELNDRVAVFEEDKMVLKAALRQLQKEIREEAPKLLSAQEGERRLREELEELKMEYEEDSDMWQQRYEEGEAEWNRTKDELVLIGTYVDQLEDRLATFAIAKKEIELREQKCKELELEAVKHTKEAESWKSQVEALSKEQGETRPLLEDLVKEREELIRETNSWKQKVEQIKSQTARELFLKIEESKREWESETIRQIEDQKQTDAMKYRELQETYEHEKTAWIAQYSQNFEQRLAQQKADMEEAFQESKSSLEANLQQEWTTKLARQTTDLEARLRNEFERSLEYERLQWREQKEQEIQDRLSEERAVWDAAVSTKNDADKLSFEEEVEKAASKVYEKLEREGISFGIDEPTIEPVKDLVQALNEFGDDKAILNATVQNTTASASKQYPWASSRHVPFRTMRKAAAKVFGLHGIITPSTVQLKQRYSNSKLHPKRHAKKKPSMNKQLEEDDLQSQKDENAPELATPQAVSDAQVENQVWEENEGENSGVSDSLNSGQDYYQQDNSWNYESEGSVELMSLVEPPPLPDLDDR
eukprot:scaffold190663_cov92-Cyclotella_meneghiniana.AAC.1